MLLFVCAYGATEFVCICLADEETLLQMATVALEFAILCTYSGRLECLNSRQNA